MAGAASDRGEVSLQLLCDVFPHFDGDMVRPYHVAKVKPSFLMHISKRQLLCRRPVFSKLRFSPDC
jgi:hypothetical protein